MNKILSIIIPLVMITFKIFSQNLPTQKISQLDFRLKKGLSQIATVAYKADSLEYNPFTLKVLQFDSQGNITNDYFRIIGENTSETMYKYVYKDDRLDSVNKSSSAASFNTDSKYHYNIKGWLDSVVCKGPRVSFTDIYTQDIQGRITSVKRMHNKGEIGFIENYFYETKGQFEYAEKKNDDGPKLTTFYVGKNEFISFEEGNDTLTFYNTNGGDFRVYDGKVIKEDIQRMRRQYMNNAEIFGTTMIERLLPKANYIYVIPVKTTAETGELIKRNVIEQAYGQNRYYLLTKYVYQDSREVGDTDFDLFFQMQVEKKGLHKMKWK